MKPRRLTTDCPGCPVYAAGAVGDAIRKVHPSAGAGDLCLHAEEPRRLRGEGKRPCRLDRLEGTDVWNERLGVPLRPHRPPLRYFGSKWRIAPWIVAHFPRHDCYVEPFCGGLSVLLRKPPSIFEYVNDLDDEVVTFFRVLRRRPAELVTAIERTPFARRELELAREPVEDGDELEVARRLYVLAWQARGGPRIQWKAGWRFQRRQERGRSAIQDFVDTSTLELVTQRLRMVGIEHGDAFAVLRRFDGVETLFYVDPPYLGDVRSERWRKKAYRHEFHLLADHARLAEALSRVRGMVVLSGYPSPLYEQLYQARGWEVRTVNAQTDGGHGDVVEALWFNPAAVERGIHPQMELWDAPEA
jgi:DNA adenine methylase